jgi:hypothetical protein
MHDLLSLSGFTVSELPSSLCFQLVIEIFPCQMDMVAHKFDESGMPVPMKNITYLTGEKIGSQATGFSNNPAVKISAAAACSFFFSFFLCILPAFLDVT